MTDIGSKTAEEALNETEITWYEQMGFDYGRPVKEEFDFNPQKKIYDPSKPEDNFNKKY